MAQMKEQNKTPEKTQKTIPSDALFKTLMIRMLKELILNQQQHKKDSGKNEGYTK